MADTQTKEFPMDPALKGTEEEWVQSIMGSSQSQSQKPPRIQKVPQMIRETKGFGKRNYAPSVVSIGPYHHDVHKLRLQQVQKLKGKIANKFVSNDKQQLESLSKKLSEKIKEVRECYEDNSTKDIGDEPLARMMLMDGCFILYYIKCVADGNEKELEMKTHHKALVQQDLFLLENQLPFLVLNVLMSNSTLLRNDEWMAKIDKFIYHNIMAAPQPLREEEKVRGPVHLLELLHRKLVGDKPIVEASPQRYTFRNVKELKAVGIYLKPSETVRLTDISYEPSDSFAHLKLPPITVDNSTKAKFLNLIAYEMCPDAPNDSQWVTSYICFLHSLIDHPEDVKLLRSAEILHNSLGRDDEVANLFKAIGTNLVPHPCAYSGVKGLIQGHCGDKEKTYKHQVKHRYFKNPWTIFVLIGAILALIFNAIQAFFQVWSPPTDCDGLCKHLRIAQHI